MISTGSCHKCGYRDIFLSAGFNGGKGFQDSYSNDIHSYDSISFEDSNDFMLEKCLQNESRKVIVPSQTPIQHSRSLSSLPNPYDYTTPSSDIKTHDFTSPNNNTETISKPNHKKLERAKGAKVLRPRVTFSEFTENINVIGNEHNQLSRKENVLKVNEKPKSILACDSKQCGDAADISNKTIEDIDSETESEDYYKTLKDDEDDYSYAYRDAFSPAVVIKLEDGNNSEYSEDIYEVIEHPENLEKARPKVRAASETPSEQDNPFFLSISKGRRNHLKLHRFVDWDLDSDLVHGGADQHLADDVDVEFLHKHQQEDPRGEGRSRLLPFLLFKKRRKI